MWESFENLGDLNSETKYENRSELIRTIKMRFDRVLIEVWQLEFLEPLELSASVEIASTTGG